MKLSKGKNQSGFTLVEVLIALVLFSIGILAVNAMQITSIGGNTKARRYTEAVNYASSQMEALLALEYGDSLLIDDDDNGVGGLDVKSGADGTLPDDEQPEHYNIVWNIADDFPQTSTTANDSVKTIRVTVSWQEGIGTKSVSLTNIKAAE